MTISNKPVSVIIVGAGFGGIAAAIELRQRGYEVTLIEKYTDSKQFGDIIDFFPNGGAIMGAWDNGRIGREILREGIDNCEKLEFYKYDGKKVYEEPWLEEPEDYYKQFGGHRGEIHLICLNYAKELGAVVKFGSAVSRYLDLDDRAAVELENGEILYADAVIAADGPKSIARQQVFNLPDTKVNSGYAIYRAFLTTTPDISDNELLKDLVTGKDKLKVWIGSHVHMLAYCWNNNRDIAWVITHKDDHEIEDSWSFPAKKSDVFKYIEKFDPFCIELVNQTPETSIIDYKLVWRDPLETWISPKGHITIIGDAAHCHLPTSAQGGAQAMEDAVCLAECLKLSDSNVKLALKAMERIRFNRANLVHQLGISNRDVWHYVDWDEIEKDPKKISGMRYDWVIRYDVLKETRKHYPAIAEDIISGKEGTVEELSLPARH
jgi:2-polyprenyl-6-methoxyphenol hydroxylase-like FAD-dependent oxidoreductase